MTRTNGRVEILDYLQRVADRIRELARTNPSDMRYQVLAIADQIAEEAAGLEAELSEAGIFLRSPRKSPSAATSSRKRKRDRETSLRN